MGGADTCGGMGPVDALRAGMRLRGCPGRLPGRGDDCIALWQAVGRPLPDPQDRGAEILNPARTHPSQGSPPGGQPALRRDHDGDRVDPTRQGICVGADRPHPSGDSHMRAAERDLHGQDRRSELKRLEPKAYLDGLVHLSEPSLRQHAYPLSEAPLVHGIEMAKVHDRRLR